MFKLINSFLKPNIVNIEKVNKFHSKITLEPMEKGFGNTIGNSLRRILLSSIPGYKITEVEIDGVYHEYGVINGIREDILEIILNIKNIPIKIINDFDFEYINIKNVKSGIIKSKDILCNDNIIIIDPDYYLFTINDNIFINMKMKVQKGIGYLYNSSYDKKNNLGKILIDTHFSPINKVLYYVENTRINNKIDLDKLIIEIETNGTIEAEESIKIAANILINQLNIFLDLNKFNNNFNNTNNNKSLNKEVISNEIKDFNKNFFIELIELYKEFNVNPIFFKKINNLNLTVRSLNCLKNDNILYIGHLVQIKEQDLLKISNLGKKSLIEIKNSLKNLNLKFDTYIKDWDKMFSSFLKIINKK
ncbi:DNA-directed RNA polymerase subunit alpha [Candidatus Nardonella dryophthoridicola]|uniref:DNA-directed RNA polymerase subunit alpha n=1 Tax=endosymbiont of Rhynchophorus ferrugineus TaxID=1972133 RepID=A0A2Z5T7X2_9GAMM|nr:DNA-directed RNA polymerase subunit alpha [Candidatus Nardonella dryophthoridicola]BBA85115.1 DNA-directed RNA polymerase subunit alpha [endosymbiont of Rhynchophorus ferrugineus]